MKLTANAGLTLALALFIPTSVRAESDVPALIMDTKPAVVSLIVYKRGLAMPGSGSGFLVAPDEVVTARHVIAGAEWADVRTCDGKYFRATTVLTDDSVWDLALVRLESAVPAFKPLVIANALPAAGDKILLVGSPAGMEWTAAEGIVAALRDVPNLGKMLQFSAAAAPGASGCPVLDMEGRVLGVAVANLAKGPAAGLTLNGLAYAVPAGRISAMLASSKTAKPVPLGLWAKDTPPDWEAPTAKNLRLTSLSPLAQLDFAGAMVVIESMKDRYPQEPLAWFKYGLAQDRCGNTAKAIEAYLKAKALSPSSDLLRDIANNLGFDYFTQGRYREAESELTQALAADPGHIGAHTNRALARMRLGRSAEALEDALFAVKADTSNTNPSAHEALGAVYLSQGRYTEAGLELDRAIAIHPDYGIALAEIGQVNNRRGRYEQAVAPLEKAIHLKCALPWIPHELGVAYASLADAETNLDGRRALYSRAVAALQPKGDGEEPRSGKAALLLGLTRLKLCSMGGDGAFDEGMAAVHALQSATEATGDDGLSREEKAYACALQGDAWYTLGVAEGRSGQKHFMESAVGAYAEAVSGGFDTQALRHNLGHAYIRLSMWDAAVQQWRWLKVHAQDQRLADALKAALPQGMRARLGGAREPTASKPPRQNPRPNNRPRRP